MRNPSIGDRVRSFDFPYLTRSLSGEHAWYVEGVVTYIDTFHVVIAVDRILCGGEEMEPHPDHQVSAPLNGLEGFAGPTIGLEILE